MIGLNLAVVSKQLPEKNGVLVAWRDGTSQVDSGTGFGFCRVLESRAHPTLGSSSDLPAEGELGLVATVDEEVSVWLGSLHYLQKNTIPPVNPGGGAPRRSFWHHDSGATLQVDQVGQFQIDLPSGLQLYSNGEDEPWPLPAGSSQATPGGTAIMPLTLAHPSGLSIKISPFGDVSITDAGSIAAESAGTVDVTAFGAVSITTLPLSVDPALLLDEDLPNPFTPPPVQPDITINITGGGDVNIQADGAVSVWGKSVAIMQGAVQFVMQPFVDYICNLFDSHVHEGVTAGSVTSGVPATPSLPVPDDSFSGDTLTGPVAE